jgi:glycosyltransferase involved in cell wall biosynthesis
MMPSTTRRTPAVCFDGTVPQVDLADVLLIARRWARRGDHTSVERFVDYLPGAQVLTTDDLWQRPDRVLHWLATRAPHEGYTIWGVEFELRAVLRALRPRRRPRIVHFLYGDHDFHHSGAPLRRLGVRTVATFFFSVEELDRRLPDKAHLRRLDLVLATGEAQRRHLARFVDPDRLAVLPLGVDTEFFHPDPAVAAVPGRLLQVGLNRRDLDTLVAAYAALRAEDDTLSLELVGCPELAPAFAGLDGVLVADHLDDDGLRRAYREAQVLLLPLEEGGSSNALNEALACGLPVVATDLPNLVDYAEPPAVRLTPPGDAAAMADACRGLLDDPAAWAEASGAARRWAEGHDWAVVRDRLLALYATVLDDRPRNSRQRR